jgi:eukaryotic-like serine/threonine-protein kinase
MKWLSDRALERLREAAGSPDLSGTRYRLVERLGRGGMGTVYLVEDTALGRRLALKVLHEPDAPADLAARLLREARILARLEHPGIVPVHDVGTLTEGRVFYTMKYVQGARLDQHLEMVHALPDRLRIFARICEAVAFAHAQGFLHRDLKPENVMVGPFGEVLVMDWGVAKVLRAQPEENPPERAAGATLQSADTEQGAVLGTPGYMAPEQARGETQNLDQRADVYSLGAILRFCLAGRGSEAIASAGDGHPATPTGRVPRALEAICAKAMASDSAGRYSSAPELAADVARYLDGLPVAAYPENMFRRAARLVSRHRVAILLVTAYLVTRVLLLILMGR